MGSYRFYLSLIFLYLVIIPFTGIAQVTGPTTDGRLGSKAITTGVPFLLLALDSRSGAMGDAGVAIFPDPNSIHWNPSKLAFVSTKTGVSLSYSPWLQK